MVGVVIKGMGILCNKQSRCCPRGLDVGGMGKTGGGGEVPASFLQWWKGWEGKQTSPLDSLMLKTEVVRSLQWWVGGRGENRAERLGIGMWCRCMTTGALGGMAYTGFVFSHPENGGYTKFRWLGGLKSMREPIVGFWQGRELWAGVVVIQWWLWAQMLHHQVVLQSLRGLGHCRPCSSSASWSLTCPPPLLSLQHAPSTHSWFNSPPLDTPRAPHQRIASPPPVVIVVVVSFVVVIVARLALHSSFHTKMVANIKFTGAWHTVVVWGRCVWQWFAPMSSGRY